MFLEKNRYHDLFFINQDGVIIYSYRKEADLGVNLLSDEYKEHNLSLSFIKAAMLLESNISSYSYYAPSDDYSAFIAYPVFFEGKVQGVIAVEFHQKTIFDIFSERRGLGLTGELLAGTLSPNGAAISMTPLRYKSGLLDRDYEYPGYENLSMNKAVRGGNGTGISIDYRDVESISAWGYIPAMNWGVVAKIDKAEVLKPLKSLELYSLLIFLFVVSGITLAIILATKNIVTPIKQLTNQVKKFAQGEYDPAYSNDLDINTRNEIEILKHNFGEMAQTIKTSQDTIKKHALELEEKVQDRTQQLEDTNVTLNRYLKIIDGYVMSSSVDVDWKIQTVSQAFCKVTGYSREELVGKNYKEVGRYLISDETYEENFQILKANKSWTGELKKQRKDGTTFWVSLAVLPSEDKSGEAVGYTMIYQGITPQKMSEEMSITDALTGVYNRRHFDDVLPKMVKAAKRENAIFCFLMLDIDHFKLYNDNYGHQMGDLALQAFAKALQNSLGRGNDTSFRLGGEEFGVIFKAETSELAVIFANRILESIASIGMPHEYSLVAPHVTASGGLYCKSAAQITSFEALYKETDELLYTAKKEGRNRVVSSVD